MKTLDEVIKAYEVCHASVLSCEGCPYDNGERYRDSDCYIADALHYLMEYRKLDSLDAVAFSEDDNPPLTMKEFSRMIDTEPIWCQELQEWYLFLAYDDGDNRIQLMTDKGDTETFDEDDLEKYPLYRRK